MRRSGIAAVLCLALVLACRALAGQAPKQAGNAPQATTSQEHQASADEEHRKKLQNDADQLIVLARKLKASVDKSNKDTLSVDVVRDAERIERLARQMREAKKM